MPYISADEVKEIRKEIKKTFPEFKFSITKKHSSSVCITLLKGPVDFGTEQADVNHFYVDEYWDGRPQEILSKIVDIAKRKQKETVYDMDYGSVPNYYVNISIGKWNRPYKLTQN